MKPSTDLSVDSQIQCTVLPSKVVASKKLPCICTCEWMYCPPSLGPKCAVDKRVALLACSPYVFCTRKEVARNQRRYHAKFCPFALGRFCWEVNSNRMLPLFLAPPPIPNSGFGVHQVPGWWQGRNGCSAAHSRVMAVPRLQRTTAPLDGSASMIEAIY